MAAASDTPDPRFLAGAELFNRGDYFAAHEVWEEVWGDCPPPDRDFHKALIQAAVALLHFGRGNHTGAARLFRSGRRYMDPYRPAHRGLDIDPFWDAMAAYLAPALGLTAAPDAPAPTIKFEEV